MTHAEIETPMNPFGASPVKFGLWLFLASEVMFFGALLGAFLVLKFAHPDEFHHDAAHLNWMLAAANTAILITSSYTMALGVSKAQAKDPSGSAKCILITMVLGLVFLCIKAFEYYGKIEHGIYPKTSIFYACYFTMTGGHALHIIGGLVSMLVIWLRGVKGTLTGESAELVGLYWHFVDLVWIFLFPLLYLL